MSSIKLQIRTDHKVDNIIVFNHDIGMYPPILSVVERLVASGQSVALCGYCADPGLINELNKKGVAYTEAIRNQVSDNPIIKLLKLFAYRRKVKAFVAERAEPNTLVWIFGNENVWVLHSLVSRYRAVIYLFEVPLFKIGYRYRLLSAFADYGKVMRSAYKVVCCEGNRAHITKSYFGLKELPLVIPNKPEISKDIPLNQPSAELAAEARKILLYQGIFNFPERRLEEICESVAHLPDEYVVILMGPDSEYKKLLKRTYESERVKFVSFIPPPHHLAVTSGAYIGFLSYFASPGDVNACLNTLYCAPNKVFEYSKFGVPMIGNDAPALQTMLEAHRAGICVPDMTPHAIAEAVMKISADYDSFRAGACRLYESVDFGALIDSVIRRENSPQWQ